MRKRPLGKTGLYVSEMGVGTWGLSGESYGPVEESDAEADRAPLSRHGDEPRRHRRRVRRGPHGSDARSRLRKDATTSIVVTKGGTDRTTDPPRKHFDAEYLKESVGAIAQTPCARSHRRLPAPQPEHRRARRGRLRADDGGAEEEGRHRALGRLGGQRRDRAHGDRQGRRGDRARLQPDAVRGPSSRRGRRHGERRGRARALGARLRAARRHAGRRTASSATAITAATAGRSSSSSGASSRSRRCASS